MSKCACGSGQSYKKCCEPYITKQAKPPTAEALLRSRFTAFSRADMDYIINTHHPKTRSDLDIKSTEQWAKNSEWLGLEIIECVDGGEQDEKGTVEFKAHLQLHGEKQEVHELSHFLKKQGEWYFLDGKSPNIKQFKRDTPKIGRNDPCSCGSGKKYKKCCGAAA